ncbi:uncharacterized protein LOC132203584 [Neocloeon triangulifer]|uniref:uncharacterized protein LOC132203584 n=1 Tax=Neocloeon triangulifer TaxID=2078957 RepID=UPI00286F9BD4|nr:uncharacterized protein LOC132203584 [Neocloeon triangulifer]XP_059487441.1 uncharacterized protein LOC132203584 [Neocloeon triangulifer]XP_059487442.1 uncharacterized protein LOC132203584 [Neocloeon triangulifer]XP_059487444.1 uncharacterized protein LOC132203584 [Neocloeon triangulifer]XP_059487445.1 uncharacterized protein LOC132203584 [Neocloeon triangulifer]
MRSSCLPSESSALLLLLTFMHLILTDASSEQPPVASGAVSALPPLLSIETLPTAKSPEARTDAPKKLLGYIFDTHMNIKHHHHDHRWGPHFEEVSNSTNITIKVGSSVTMNCRISLLQDKTVSWVRRKDGKELELLTVGLHTYTGDSRYTVEFQYPNNWRLQIKYANKRDEGTYECQISTYPPRVIRVHLHIKAPEVLIVDEHGRPIFEKYYKADSTIQLACFVRHVSMVSSVVLWNHGNNTLNYDVTRGGISVKTELMEDGANSSLAVARADKADSGNYTCSISATEFATVAVHVLNGENPAELHHGSGSRRGHKGNPVALGLVLLAALVHTLR